MAELITPPISSEDVSKLRDDWFHRLGDLIGRFEVFAREQGWSTRRIEKQLEDPTIGRHRAPALLMQEGVTRLILEPIGRSAPGVEGVVDLYQLPAYDDIATLFCHAGSWVIRYPLPDDPIAHRDEAVELKPLTIEVLERVLRDLIRNDS